MVRGVQPRGHPDLAVHRNAAPPRQAARLRIPVKIRSLGEHDLADVLSLNNAAVPHVNELDLGALEEIVASARACAVADAEGSVAGALIAIGPGAEYASPNYRWFSAEYDDFVYVDRIVVGDSHRGVGFGRAFYDWLQTRLEPRRITCEVNEIPPNPRSMAFHEALGFKRVGTLSHGDGETVALLCRESTGAELRTA